MTKARPDTREERRSESPEEPTPGSVGRAALRIIDAAIDRLQRWRRHFDGGDGESPDRQAGHRAAAHEEAAAETPRRGFFLRGALIALLCLAVGGAAGGFWAYRLLAGQLAEHDAEVERLQGDIDAAKKEETRSANLVTRLQRENGEMRLQVREAQRTARDAEERAGELDKALAAAKRPVRPPAPAPAAARARARAPAVQGRAPLKSVDCSVGGADTGTRLSECIERFNRP
jgi:hypothetical protein